MKFYFYFIIVCLLISSCSQNNSKAEKKYIENLEEKNRLLEKELQEAKSKEKLIKSSSETKQRKETPKEYFTIGSTEDEVLDVMGEPTTYHDFPWGRKIFNDDGSSMTFEKGRVKSYSNIGDNLKVRVRK